MRKIFCFIFGISFASFGMKQPPSEVEKLIDTFNEVHTCLESRQNSDPKFRENNVLFVGPTGAGKDSLLFYLKEIELTITPSSRLEASAALEGVRIGHGCSETIIPASVVVDGITYWSCPGFGDTGGSTKDLVNMFAISNVLRGNIKIVLVIDEGSMTFGRQQGIFKCLRKIKTNMLPNVSKDLLPHLGLIVTRGESETYQRSIPRLLAKINRKDFDYDYSDVVGTVKYLIENKRIAYFPEPSSSAGVYPTNYRNGIHQMIQNIPDYLKLGNDTIKMHIEDGPKVLLREMRAELLAQTNDILENHLFKSIEILLDNFSKEFSVTKEMGKKTGVFNRNPQQASVADKINEIKTKKNAVDKDTEDHVSLERIHNFFMDILHDNSNATEHLEQIKRISTHVEFVSKYCDDPFVIDKWKAGLQRLDKKLSDCENHIFNKQVKAAVATTVGVAAVGFTAAATTGALTTNALVAGANAAGQAIAGSAAGQAIASGVATVSSAVATHAVAAGTSAGIIIGSGLTVAVQTFKDAMKRDNETDKNKED